MQTHLFLMRRAAVRFLAFSLILCLFLGCTLISAAAEVDLEVHFIDVGQGDSIFVSTPDGATMLVDAGDYRAGPWVTRYLQSLGVNQIDVVVGTHPHADHIGGMVEVISSFKVGRVYDSGRLHTSQTYENYLKAIDAKNIPFSLARSGDAISLGNLVSITVLWPEGPRRILDYRSLNESSIVLLLEYGNTQFLLTGDAGAESEQGMMKSGRLKPVTVLKVGHHGSHSSTSQAFLTKIRPKLAVIMCGSENSYGHPHQEVLDRLAAARGKILRTDQQGSIIIKSDGTELELAVSSQATLWPTTTDEHSGLVNVNFASAKELESLPGIGETLAQRIIEYRIKVGLFTEPADLLKVKGIGEATLAKIRTLITF